MTDRRKESLPPPLGDRRAPKALAYANPPMMICGECSSMLLIERARDHVAPVRCLNKDCARYDRVYAYRLARVELEYFDTAPTPAEPYK